MNPDPITKEEVAAASALEQAAVWFAEYRNEHAAKLAAATSNSDKARARERAERNAYRSRFCQAAAWRALDASRSRPGGDDAGEDDALVREARTRALQLHDYRKEFGLAEDETDADLIDRLADRLSRRAGGEGWVRVPKEPTLAMLKAGQQALGEWRRRLKPDEKMLRHVIRNGRNFHQASEDEKFRIRWAAMLASAPPEPDALKLEQK